jgi:hypothetical protein
MSTLKRDQWRRLLKSWIVWVSLSLDFQDLYSDKTLKLSCSRWYEQTAWSYAEAFSDQTIGLIIPFYGQIKIILLLSLSIPRYTVSHTRSDQYSQPRRLNIIVVTNRPCRTSTIDSSPLG